MKSYLSIALLIDVTQNRDRLEDLLEFAIALQAAGYRPQLFALVPAGFDSSAFSGEHFSTLSCFDSDSLLIPITNRPCSFGGNESIRQRIQELIDPFDASPVSYDLYHGFDPVSATALAMMQGMGFIDQFVYSVSGSLLPQSSYLSSCQGRALATASQCLCSSEAQRQELQFHYNIQAPVLAMPSRSRVQRRRLRERGSGEDGLDLLTERWRETVQQHGAIYEHLLNQPVQLRYA